MTRLLVLSCSQSRLEPVDTQAQRVYSIAELLGLKAGGDCSYFLYKIVVESLGQCSARFSTPVARFFADSRNFIGSNGA